MTRIALATIFLLTASVAVAQEPTRVVLGGTGTYIIDLVGSAAAAIITGLLGWATAAFTKKTGFEIEQKHRDALHSAAMTGITLALSKLRGTAATISVPVQNEVVAQGVQWVISSVPDAIKYFGLDKAPEKLTSIVESKLGTLQENAVTVVEPAPAPGAGGA